jgi:hypothetical protein
MRGRTHRAATAAAALACTAAIAGCGDTLQGQQVAPGTLEPLVTQPHFPVYWLGGAYDGLKITGVGRDQSGAYDIQYGNCRSGGATECTAPIEIVTSPDNGFLPGGEAPGRTVRVRGAKARESEAGRAIATATGPVVVDVYATSAALAHGAAEAMVEIGGPQTPGGPLEPAQPPTSYGAEPLPSQQPPAAPTGAKGTEEAGGGVPEEAGRTAIVMRVSAHNRPASSLKRTSQTQVVRPRCSRTAWAWRKPSVIGRRKLVPLESPIATHPSAWTAIAVAIEARDSATEA